VIDIRYLTSQLRKKLKKPLGILFHSSLEETISMLKMMIEKEKPAKIVTVGDQVSQNLADHSLLPDVLIIDNKIMRKKIAPISVTADQVVNVNNPPGTITDEAWLAVEKAIADSQRTKIVVEGEEDLLALVAILAVPENSLVLYGQPRKGVVAVKATAKMKKRVQEIVEAMKND
jgi:uncharacterized protein (UPF0218 family)